MFTNLFKILILLATLVCITKACNSPKKICQTNEDCCSNVCKKIEGRFPYGRCDAAPAEVSNRSAQSVDIRNDFDDQIDFIFGDVAKFDINDCTDASASTTTTQPPGQCGRDGTICGANCKVRCCSRNCYCRWGQQFCRCATPRRRN